ncbi:hypothetical protein PVL29_017440 [Vitis rotundifolia]|uniref:Glutaredoxin domain-containing protein n=1 Tax=Vitis rotundifolia TaxID=103349 RepID=A0AA39DKH6_VITRO|nr:hypothetical protein PVL29_017440 [Vitis rotundifolia]
MADSGNSFGSFGKSKSRPFFFGRSMTVREAPIEAPQLDRSGSMRKFYNSFESVISTGNSIKGKVKKLCSLFEKADDSQSQSQPQSRSQSPTKLKASKLGTTDLRVSSLSVNHWIGLPGAEDRIVVYFTSLRGIRRTYEDCYAVRMIFRAFRVWVDERDISMDSAYRKELQCVLGEKNVSLPQVFIRGKYMGGADVVKQLYETGELAKILEGFPVRAPGHVCESCGDVRFIPCMDCSGSRKVFDEDEGLLKRCLECNENGLIRCPDCCS